VQVQHHHAHVASVMAEHALRGPVLGVAFDGTGLGPDGTVWGGEFLLCDERSYRRVGHLSPVRQPGGDRCAREGWRMAIAYLHAAALPHQQAPASVRGCDDAPAPRRWASVSRVVSSRAAPISTSAGRLFDAVASLLGVAQESSFEAEAAMRLEAIAATAGALGGVAPIAVPSGGTPLVVDTTALLRALVAESMRGRPAAELAAVFHESMAHAIARTCHALCRRHGVARVALSGGVFQNALLLKRTTALLRDRGLQVHTNCAVPCNDGGVSLGQALVATALDNAEDGR
jgi:hydrogenase maturation protein HypF